MCFFFPVRSAPVTNIGFLHFQLPLAFLLTNRCFLPEPLPFRFSSLPLSILRIFLSLIHCALCDFPFTIICAHQMMLLLLLLLLFSFFLLLLLLRRWKKIVCDVRVKLAPNNLIGTYTFLFCARESIQKIIALKMMHASTCHVMLLLRLLQKIIKFMAQISLSCN